MLQPEFAMSSYTSVSNSSIDFFFFPRMVRMIYRATTMKSSVDIAIASRCGEWSSGIDPRHRRRIIAATIGVGCEKEGGVDQASFLLEKDEDRAG